MCVFGLVPCLLTPSPAHTPTSSSGYSLGWVGSDILGLFELFWAVRHRGQPAVTGFGSCFQGSGWIGDGGGWAGQDGALGCPREQPKENPGAGVARRAGKMLMAVQHDEELGEMLGRPPSRPGKPPWCRGWRAAACCSALEIFALCFSELLFQAGQEVSCFQRNPWLSQAGL